MPTPHDVLTITVLLPAHHPSGIFKSGMRLYCVNWIENFWANVTRRLHLYMHKFDAFWDALYHVFHQFRL